MFICNVSLKNNLFRKVCIAGVGLIVIIIFIVVGYKFYKAASVVTVKDSVHTSMLEVNNDNYTSILKDAHENIDKYVGKKMKFTGFVYRIFDFKDNQFVLAREMIIPDDTNSNHEKHAVIVGFLCECSNLNNFKDGSWVEIEGIIKKGNYHGDIPVIDVKTIQETNIPDDEFVYPPDGSYINSEQ